jgi:phage terminase large subunit-like protein
MADGEPGAEIYTAATKRDQARNRPPEEAVAMTKASEALRKRGSASSRTISTSPRRARKYEPLGADADTMDGLNVHAAIIDELHAHKTRALWDVLETATGARRQPLMWAVTTAGWDRHSICWEQHNYSEQILDNVILDDTFFAYIASIDKGDDWRDPKVWAKANPNYGVSVKPDDLKRKAEKAEQLPSAQNAFKRLHLDVWTEQAERWLDIAIWDACNGPIDVAALKGKTCFAGLDLSSTLDLSALALLFPMDDGTIQAVAHFWLPEDNMKARVERDRVPYDVWASQGFITLTPGNVIDYDFIREEAKRLASLYRFGRFGYDPYNATQLVIQLQGDGLDMVPVRQGFLSLNAPSKELEKRITSKKIVHDGNPVLRWMMSNAAIERDAAGNIKPAKDKSSEKIDGVIALIIALDQLSRGGGGESVYESRGITVI